MGAVYVVGFEMAKSVFRAVDIQEFRKIVRQIRENPDLLINSYKELCDNDKNLPRLPEINLQG